MGRILPANKTGCTTKTQRRLSKAIRRARALGFMSIWSRHPHFAKNSKIGEEQREPERRMFQNRRARNFLNATGR
jgi:hypothetical protein